MLCRFGLTTVRFLGRLTALAVLAAFMLGAAAAPAAADRSYTFPLVLIEAGINDDGSMNVAEHRTVNYRGTFSGMYRDIPKQPGVQIVDVAVEENGVPYKFYPGSAPGPDGTYYVADRPDRLHVDWSFSARYEVRTFTLRYRVLHQVQVHADVAELYYKFIEDDRDIPVDDAVVRLSLPPGAGREEIRAWGHGPLHGQVSIESPQLVLWQVSPLPRRTFLEGRVTFPPELVPGAAARTGITALPEILAEEEAWAAQANRQRLVSRFEWGLGLFVFLSGLALTFFFWTRYGREHRASFEGDYFRELPAEYSPAELGVLWRFGKPGAEDFTATIVDLARRGYLVIEEHEPETGGILERFRRKDYRLVDTGKRDELREHERKVMELLFARIASAQPGTVSFSDIENHARRHREAFARFWQDWQKGLSGQGALLGFFDRDTARMRMVQVALGVLFLFPALLLFFWEMNIAGSALVFAGLVLVLGGALLRRRSRSGVEDFVRWRAFRRFLLHFSEMKRHELPTLVIWEHYLVYAVTLGVAREVLKQLQVVYPTTETGARPFGHGWYRGHTPGVVAFQQLGTSFQSMTGSVQQSLRAATSSSSSGAGRGGGFSGGGGRGGGGGGVGMR